MKYLKSVLFLSFLFWGLTASCVKEGETEILWDKWGVPHIYAGSAADMYMAFGYAQMKNHANLILRLYGQSRGRASEYWGKDFLLSDKKILLFEIPSLASANYSRMKPEYRSYLEAFAEGINKYAKENAGEIDDKLEKVLPVTPVDILSHTMRVLNLEFIASDDIAISFNLVQPGSNAVAIAPSRSASGNAMMITNPHLPWSDFFTWFEAHLNSDGFMAYGISLVGTVPLSMAFNNNLGWAFTVNTLDASDRYELKLKDNGYVLDGSVLPFRKKSVVIKILQNNGAIKEEKTEFLYSKHGPVTGVKDDKAYAVRIAGLENYDIFEQFHKMSAAKNLGEFESAMKMLQIPMFNIIYADRNGNILYLFNGNIPVRNTGDYAYWKGTIAGTDSKLIWDKTHQYQDLPRVLNPPSGFISNCNDAPWTCTEPVVLNPADYPAYIAPRGTFLRPQRSVNMIKPNQSVTFDQLVGFKHNTTMEAAERFLDDLLGAVEKVSEPKALSAANVLRKWDMKTDSGSRGAVLFANWWNMVNNKMFAVPWSIDNPNNTPDGINDPKKAVDMLVQAAYDVEQKYGALGCCMGRCLQAQVEWD